MKLSKKGAMSLIAEEAISLGAYQDSAGVWTIGVGHTAAAGWPFPKAGMTMTLPDVIKLLRADLDKFETGVSKAIKVPLAQNEFDALVLFHFNTGAISSGSVDDKLNAGDRAGALNTMLQYRKAGGKVLDGLEKRRAREVAMFSKGEYFPRAVAFYERFPQGHKALDPINIPWPDDVPSAPLQPDIPDVHETSTQQETSMGSIISTVLPSLLRHSMTTVAGVLVTYGVIAASQQESFVTIAIGVITWAVGQGLSFAAAAKK